MHIEKSIPRLTVRQHKALPRFFGMHWTPMIDSILFLANLLISSWSFYWYNFNIQWRERETDRQTGTETDREMERETEREFFTSRLPCLKKNLHNEKFVRCSSHRHGRYCIFLLYWRSLFNTFFGHTSFYISGAFRIILMGLDFWILSFWMILGGCFSHAYISLLTTFLELG